MASAEPARPTAASLLSLSTTLLSAALACGLGLLFLINLPQRQKDRKDSADSEPATFKGDPLFVVQFPRLETDTADDRVRDLSLTSQPPIPDRLPPLAGIEPGAPDQLSPEFPAAEQMFEAFPEERYQSADLQPEFEPEPVPQQVRRPGPRSATGRAAAMQPRGVVNSSRTPVNPQQLRPSARPQPRENRRPASADPDPMAIPEFAAELRSMKQQLSEISRQLASRPRDDQGSKPQSLPHGPTQPPKPPAGQKAAPRQLRSGLVEQAFDPLAESTKPHEASADNDAMPQVLSEPSSLGPNEPATVPEPEPVTATEPAPEPEPEPMPEPEPVPQPEPEPAPVATPMPSPEPAAEPSPVPAELPSPAPAEPVSPAAAPDPVPTPELPPAPAPAPEPPLEPAPPGLQPGTVPELPVAPPADPVTTSDLIPPQPTEPLAHIMPPPVPAIPNERLAGMRPVPPPLEVSMRPLIRGAAVPGGVPQSMSHVEEGPAVQPLSVKSRAHGEVRMPATAAPPFHGGTLVRGGRTDGTGKSENFRGALAGVRETFTEGLEELPGRTLPSPGWLRTLFTGRKSSRRSESQLATKQSSGSRSPSTVVPPTPSMFAEQPAGGVLRASASSLRPPVGGSIERALHSSSGPDAGPPQTPQTQYRSLRDGHNKPGSLFNPHAWVAPAWLAEPSGR